MKRMSHPHAAEQLAQLVTQFEHWRQHRVSRAERIPPALWKQAVALTTVLPLSRVATCLRVSWSDLHTQCAAARGTAAAEPAPPPLHFVEVPPVAGWPLPPLETTIELQRPDGARLRIATHEAAVPFVTLIRTFLEPPGCSN
jgi:hypothetical protein